MAKPTMQLNVRISPEVDDALRHYAIIKRTTKVEVVEAALRRYLKIKAVASGAKQA